MHRFLVLLSCASACYGIEGKYNNNALLKNTGKRHCNLVGFCSMLVSFRLSASLRTVSRATIYPTTYPKLPINAEAVSASPDSA